MGIFNLILSAVASVILAVMAVNEERFKLMRMLYVIAAMLNSVTLGLRIANILTLKLITRNMF